MLQSQQDTEYFQLNTVHLFAILIYAFIFHTYNKYKKPEIINSVLKFYVESLELC